MRLTYAALRFACRRCQACSYRVNDRYRTLGFTVPRAQTMHFRERLLSRAVLPQAQVMPPAPVPAASGRRLPSPGRSRVGSRDSSRRYTPVSGSSATHPAVPRDTSRPTPDPAAVSPQWPWPSRPIERSAGAVSDPAAPACAEHRTVSSAAAWRARFGTHDHSARRISSLGPAFGFGVSGENHAPRLHWNGYVLAVVAVVWF
jgi:hypothetical protein